MIRIFPSPFSDPGKHDPIWSGPVEPGETVLELIRRLVPSYDPCAPVPWSCKVNGLDLPPSRYGRAVLGAETSIDFFLTPRGDVLNAVLNIFTLGAWSLVMKFLTPKVGGANGGGGGGRRDRDDLDQAAVKANTVKQGAVVREKFGEGRIYPDHLTQIRRFFVAGQPKRQAAEMFLCLGRGKFQVDLGRSKVGETLQAALGDNLVVRLYEPGANLAGEPMADNWYTSSEVGGTSGGSAGLDLTVTSPVPLSPTASSYAVSGVAVQIPTGAGTWPEGWTAGMIVRAEVPYQWTVSDGPGGSRDRISGPWSQVAPFVGMLLEVSGGFNDNFLVNSVVMAGSSIDYVTLDYPNGSPVSALPVGAFSLSVGYSGMRFRLLSRTDQNITLERLTDTGATDPTWPGFTPLSTTAALFTLDATNTAGGFSGPYAACPEGETTNRLELDFFYPAGLYRISSSSGSLRSHSVTVEAQYRDRTTAGPWTSVRFTHSSREIAQVGFTHGIDLPSHMAPEVQTRRITFDSPEGNISDQVQWYGLKARLRTRANSYPGLSTAAVRVFGGGALAAQAEQMVSFWCTRILPSRQGGQWVSERPTRSIRDAALYLLKDRGYTDDRLDLAEWDRLDAIWQSRGDFFDGSFEKETTAEEALKVICRPGYAEVIAPRGVLRPVRDVKRSEAEKASARLYGVGNSTDIKRSGQPVNPNDTDGVDVKYRDPVTWTTETVKCRIPGAPEPNKVSQLTLEGVNDRTRAWRLGMRELTAARYRRWRNTFSCDMSAFASAYMDYCEIQDFVPDLAAAGHLRADLRGGRFESNEPIPVDATQVAMRRPDGTKFGPVGFVRLGDYTFELNVAPDFEPLSEAQGGQVPTHLFFGKLEEMFWPVLMAAVTPSGQFRANVEALGYDERVYQFDDQEPPADA